MTWAHALAPRGAPALVVVAAFAALAFTLFVAGRASADPKLRPYDAPRLERARAQVPPIPPEYLPHDEGWIHFAYHPSARERVRPLFAQADAIRAALQAELGRPVLTSVEVRVAAVPAEMARLAPAELPSYAPAVAFGELGLVVMSLSSPLSLEPPDLDELLRHELAHVALDEALGPGAVPRWVHEGYAVRFSGEDAAGRAQTLTSASLRQRLLPTSLIEESFPADAPRASIAYAEAADFLRFLLAGPRRSSFPAFVERARAGDELGPALAGAYGGDPAALEHAWRKDVARRYGFVPVLGAGAALWLIVAGVAVGRRLRKRRAMKALVARRARKAEGSSRAAVDRRERPRAPRAITLRGRTIVESDELADTFPPDPEVPKVEHDGRWHTLH